MTSLVKDLSDGVRLIQLMVSSNMSLRRSLTDIEILGNHGYVLLRLSTGVINDTNQAIPPSDGIIGTHESAYRRLRM